MKGTTMNKLNLLAITFASALLVGCASVPMTSPSLDADAKKFTPDSGQANIYVYRGGGPGTAVTVQTLLDGRVVGSLAPNTYQLLTVAPGQRVLSTGGGAESVEMQKLQAEPGKNYFFRVSLSMGWAAPRVHMKPMGEDEGR